VFDASSHSDIAYTVYDSGGTDTLNYSEFSAAQVIDLNPESFSNVGGRVGNVSIARGVVIENALGGSGNDKIVGNGANNALTGGAGADVLFGGSGDDILSADRHFGFDNGTTVDEIYGGPGNDMIFSGYGDIVDGGDGFDTVGLSYVGASTGITGDTAILHKGVALVPGGGTFLRVERFSDIALTQYNDKMVIGDQADPATVRSWDGDDHLVGQEMSITMYGGNGNDLLVGGTSDDILLGENGDDKLIGYFGVDQLWGGEGSDVFYFVNFDLSDRILDFQVGIDRIDVTSIDANSLVSGDQEFTFIGAASFSGVAGQLRTYWDNNAYFIAGDVDGDRSADLLIRVDMVNAASSSQLNSVDFLL
jgi:Ca2+-binding RTX toxin-like protein